jgi:hypothetical protein
MDQQTNDYHIHLEYLAEEAEDYLNDLNIPLISHSYGNIIEQARKHGFDIEAYCESLSK